MTKPSLFVIGDSISIQYGPYLESYIGRYFDYSRRAGEEEALQNLDIPMGSNCGDSSMVLQYMTALQTTGTFHPSVIQINCGLHDLRVDLVTSERQVPLHSYIENLQQIARIAESMCDYLVWVRITPIDEEMHNEGGKRGYLRYNSDVDAYNNAADEIMREAGAAIADLHSFTRNIQGDLFTDGVHFLEPVSALQAAFLAGFHLGRGHGLSSI